MAKQMSYVDMFGNSQAESYWRVVVININMPSLCGEIVFHGYKDAAARNANKAPIGSKVYTIAGNTFLTLFAQHLEPGGPNIAVMAYDYATNCLDMTDEENNPISFFANALDV